jgi:hypothetical protein
VVEHVVVPKEIILNDLMTHVYINGSNPTPMSFKLKFPEGLDPLVRSKEFLTSGQVSIPMMDILGSMGSP